MVLKMAYRPQKHRGEIAKSITFELPGFLGDGVINGTPRYCVELRFSERKNRNSGTLIRSTESARTRKRSFPRELGGVHGRRHLLRS